MILLDYSQTAISNIMMNLNSKEVPDINLVRHMILSSIRSYLSKFKNEYGQLVIAVDGHNYWRKKAFPHYKFGRRKDDSVPWDQIFECLNQVRKELQEFFPYIVIHTDEAEADDVIASIIQLEHHNSEFGISSEKFMIISGDKDYIQLQRYRNVKQYDPIRKKMIISENPLGELLEKVIKGDSGDSVPNCLSPDNTFYDGIRQTPMTKSRFEDISRKIVSGNFEELDEETRNRYCRNELLIDLSFIPLRIQETIWYEYESQKDHPKTMNLMNYFIKNKLKQLMSDIGDFQ